MIDCKTAVRWEDGYQRASVINHTISSGPHTRGQETLLTQQIVSRLQCFELFFKLTLTAPSTVNQLVDKLHCESVTKSIKFSQSVSKRSSNSKPKNANKSLLNHVLWFGTVLSGLYLTAAAHILFINILVLDCGF